MQSKNESPKGTEAAATQSVNGKTDRLAAALKRNLARRKESVRKQTSAHE